MGGGKAHPKYPNSFRLVVAGSMEENDWRTRSSMGKESHTFLSSMNPSFCLSGGNKVSNINKLVAGDAIRCEKKDVILTFNHQEIIAMIAVCDEDFFSGFFSAFLAKASHLLQNLSKPKWLHTYRTPDRSQPYIPNQIYQIPQHTEFQPTLNNTASLNSSRGSGLPHDHHD